MEKRKLKRMVVDFNRLNMIGNLLFSGYSFTEHFEVVATNLSMISPGVWAFRSIISIPFSADTSFLVDFIEVKTVNESRCVETFYNLHSSGKTELKCLSIRNPHALWIGFRKLP